jgi:galactokinase
MVRLDKPRFTVVRIGRRCIGAAFFLCGVVQAQGTEYVLACDSVASGADCTVASAVWSPAPVSWIPGLSSSAALEIAAAVILLWASAWAIKMVRRLLENH